MSLGLSEGPSSLGVGFLHHCTSRVDAERQSIVANIARSTKPVEIGAKNRLRSYYDGRRLGKALGDWIGGVIFDMMGSYDLALIISVVDSVAGAVSILLLIEPTNRLLIP